MIPIMICFLADSMMVLDKTQLPMPLDPALLLTLDIGAENSDHISRVMKDHKHNWWTGCKPQDLNSVKVFDAMTFADSLEHYERQCFANGPGDSSAMTMASNITHADTGSAQDMPMDVSEAGSGHAGPSHLNASTDITWSGNPSNPSCWRCEQYWYVISNLLHDVLKFYTFSMAMSMVSENQWQLGMCWASTFHQLHEGALLKCTHAFQYIATTAAADLTRLQQLPLSAVLYTPLSDLIRIQPILLRSDQTLHSSEQILIRF